MEEPPYDSPDSLGNPGPVRPGVGQHAVPFPGQRQRGEDAYSPTAGFQPSQRPGGEMGGLRAPGAEFPARLEQYGRSEDWLGSARRPPGVRGGRENNNGGGPEGRYPHPGPHSDMRQLLRMRLRRGLPNLNLDEFLDDDDDIDGGGEDEVFSGHELRRRLSSLTPGALEGSKVGTLRPSDRKRAAERVFAKETIASHLLQTSTTKLVGYRKWRHERSKDWKHIRLQLREWFDMVEIWRGTFKDIEGHFGSAIVAYYRVIKWLFLMNIFIMVVILCVIILPQQFFKPSDFATSVDGINITETRFVMEARICSKLYDESMHNITSTESIASTILDFVQGKGWMEQTLLFAGFYFNKTFVFDDEQHAYNMPLAYLLATATYFLVTLILMVGYTAQSGTESSLTGVRGKTLNSLCNRVFCAWDYSLMQEKAARLKHLNLLQQYKNVTAEARRHDALQRRTLSRRAAIYTARLLINLIIIAMCLGAFYLIYEVEQVWKAALLEKESVRRSSVLSLVVEYLPSFTITLLNALLPAIFYKIVAVESLSPDMEVRITIGRSVILRLVSIIVLVLSLRTQITDCDQPTCGNCAPIQCWETYVGQQFYKLIIFDFFVVLFVTFCVEFPRKFIVTKFPNNCLIKFVGLEEFELPKNVLDIVYSQTISWIGGFFCPLIPAITVVKFFIYFYVKKLTLVKNCLPSSRPYRASRTNAFFMSILLISFVLCIITIAYTVGRMSPSQGCSPFRIYSIDDAYMYRAVTDSLISLSSRPKQFLRFIGSWLFYVPTGILLCLVIYYNLALVSANKRMVAILKDQLLLVGKDKRFLIRMVMQAMEERNTATQ